MNVAFLTADKRVVPGLMCKTAVFGNSLYEVDKLPLNADMWVAFSSSRPSDWRVDVDVVKRARKLAESHSIEFLVCTPVDFYKKAEHHGMELIKWRTKDFWVRGHGAEAIKRYVNGGQVTADVVRRAAGWLFSHGMDKARFAADGFRQAALRSRVAASTTAVGLNRPMLPAPAEAPEPKSMLLQTLTEDKPDTHMVALRALVRDVVTLMPHAGVTEIAIVGDMVQVKRTEMRPVEVKEDW